ncbi:MAG: 30S ribosomal protein S20 [Sutterellaceae bacterium]|nr:30S ribosomal protein S20 [Sutterellaceae bacterium]
MANTNQARKRARQAVARNQHLSAQRSQYRTAIKAVRKFIVAGDKTAAAEAFKKAQRVIDSMSSKGVLHKNAAARHKSRLSASIKAMA